MLIKQSIFMILIFLLFKSFIFYSQNENFKNITNEFQNSSLPLQFLVYRINLDIIRQAFDSIALIPYLYA